MILIFILSLLVNLNYSLNPTEFCFLKDQNKTCNGDLKQKCSQIICTNNESNCYTLQLWSTYISSFKDTKDVQKEKTHFKELLSKIDDCSEQEYKWQISHICKNYKKCPFKSQIWSLNFKSIKMEQCPCKKKFNFDCGNRYCALNERGCKGLFERKNFHKNEIKKC
jgi:hypothetical protein